ncbi:hypothetical protein CQ054_02770 [Ochrobactrum sp. MYb29]|nr:hypothetical protein CQ054_02770 [Ochrobactrum sp. MYb29]
MIEPSLALQAAINAALTDSAEVAALVDPMNIRSGTTRPDELPCIIISPVTTQNLGYASGNQKTARILLDVHIWAEDDGIDTAWKIGFAVCNALYDAPRPTDSFVFAEWEKPLVRWMRDPDPARALCHGVVSINAVLMWKE